MPSQVLDRQREVSHTKKEGPMKTEAGAGVIWPQAKEC